MFSIFTPQALLILVLVTLVGGAAGWGLARWGQAGLAWALVGLTMLAALAVTGYGLNQPGLEGLFPSTLGLLVIAPVGLAAALGILADTLRRRRAAIRASQDPADGPGPGGGRG